MHVLHGVIQEEESSQGNRACQGRYLPSVSAGEQERMSRLEGGTALAIDRVTHAELCCLKNPDHLVVRTICYNRWDDTIIVVSHSRMANDGLSLTVFSRESVKLGSPVVSPKSTKLHSLLVPYPGFIEFEETNGIIVTSTARDQKFQFWDMETYSVVFSVPNTDFKELRISRGTVAFFRQPVDSKLSVRLCSLVDGKTLADGEILLHPNRDLRFLELCGCYLLVKQDVASIRVHDLVDNKEYRIRGTKEFLPKTVSFFSPNAMKELSRKPTKEATLFLAVHPHTMEICCCSGGNLTSVLRVPVEPPKSENDCTQIDEEKEVLLIYHSARFPAYSRSTQIKSQDRSSSKRSDFPGLLGSQEMYREDYVNPRDVKSERGISVVDLKTGNRICFINLQCESSMSVLLYDSLQNEILAGGSQGLHRIKTTFEMTKVFDNLTSSQPYSNNFDLQNQQQPQKKLRAIRENRRLLFRSTNDLLNSLKRAEEDECASN